MSTTITPGTTEPAREPPLGPGRGERSRLLRPGRGPWQEIGFENEGAQRLARGLGWFSIGFGIAALVMPRRMAEITGTPDRPLVFRAVGAREILTGVGILGRRRPAGWIWGRVAGDAVDLGLLGTAAARAGRDERRRIAVAGAAVAGIAALDVVCGLQLSRGRAEMSRTDADAARVVGSILVNCEPQRAFRSWRSRAPMWIGEDNEIVGERQGTWLSWRAFEALDGRPAGSVLFEPAPGGRGTLVWLTLQASEDGNFGATMPAGRRKPKRRLLENLRKFKQLVETGEIATTEGQPSGRRSFLFRRFGRRRMQ